MSLDWNGILTEVSDSLNYVVAIFLLQIAIFFSKQWYDDRKNQLSNISILSYGLYYFFFSIGGAIAFYFGSRGGNPFDVYPVYMVLASSLRGIGGVLFAFIIEWRILKKTKYLISISLIALLSISPFLINTPIISQIIGSINLILLGLPIIFTLYFMGKTYGVIRQKLFLALLGLILVGVGLAFSTYNLNQQIQSVFPSNVGFFTLSMKFLIIFSVILIIYGFHGYSFFLETEWKSNLISLYIIDKNRNIELYHKDFLESEINREEMFAGGIAGLAKIVKDFSKSRKEVDIINLGKNNILLAHGETIIATMLVKKELQHAQYFLKTIILKFEAVFYDYLKNYETYQEALSQKEIFQPMEILIRDIIKL